MNKILILTDNLYVYNQFKRVITPPREKTIIGCSPGNLNFVNILSEINVNDIDGDDIDLIISLHCQQIIPPKILKKIRCINVHPGYLPYNRGWYPHIFSMINGLPTGTTIHEMTEKIDSGPIIFREKIDIMPWDTSESLYYRIIDKEIDLLEKNWVSLLEGNYSTFLADEIGNYNSKSDFRKLCNLDLTRTGTFQEFYNILRALSFTGYQNAHFIDANGNTIGLELKVTNCK
ncbi:MAG: hypothetical protein IJG38_13680 [Thermoguttaceae bacterium]|nr:hypothetical protein [Thermoguttaceae bacterium]